MVNGEEIWKPTRLKNARCEQHLTKGQMQNTVVMYSSMVVVKGNIKTVGMKISFTTQATKHDRRGIDMPKIIC